MERLPRFLPLRTSAHAQAARPAGIRVKGLQSADSRSFFRRAEELGLQSCIAAEREGRDVLLSLHEHVAAAWLPESDTMRISRDFNLQPSASAADLEKEIVLAMLLAPLPIEYPSFAELASAIRMRMNIVAAARRTQLAFDTEAAERPSEYWSYDEHRGFTIRPGSSLIAGLEKATQPDSSGKLYSFSCYRATEYVILLGLAQELAGSNPRLLARLQSQWEAKAIKSGAFHDAFLHEYGSLHAPIPMRYYVPGDRIWFRNPDAQSSDVSGFEGSWVFYLGEGLFSNFWDRDRPYTLASKCTEIYHWRHGIRRDKAGRLYMDEDEVARRVVQTSGSKDAVVTVLDRMMRLRDPGGVYADGGCIDATREFPRWVRPGTATVLLPKLRKGALRAPD